MLASEARPNALEQLLYGVELPASPGGAVDPNTRLRSYKLGDWRQEAAVDAYPETGSRFNAMTILGTEHSSNDFSGPMTHSQDHIMYDSCMGKVTPVTVGTNGRKRTYALDPYTPIDPQTYTFWKGSPKIVSGYHLAEMYAYGFFSGFKLTMGRGGSGKSGNLLARAVARDQAISSTIGTIAYDPVQNFKWYVKTATSYAGLAAAPKMREAFDTSFEYSSVFNVAFPMVDDNISFEFPVELMPTSVFTINLMRRAIGWGFLDNLRGAETVYFEVGNVGKQIEAGPPIVNRSFKLIVAGNFSKPFDPTTINPGIAGIQWSFFPVPQDDMPNGAAFVLETVNNIT
jgi:hypothetical protein